MTSINIFLNGEPREVPNEIDLDALLDLLSLHKQRVAIEVNDSVVRRSNWPTKMLCDDDKVEIVHFVGGG